MHAARFYQVHFTTVVGNLSTFSLMEVWSSVGKAAVVEVLLSLP